MIVEDDHASVLRNYDYQFPSLIDINGNVVEIRKAVNEKMVSLTIFFDTLSFEFFRKSKMRFILYFKRKE